ERSDRAETFQLRRIVDSGARLSEQHQFWRQRDGGIRRRCIFSGDVGEGGGKLYQRGDCRPLPLRVEFRSQRRELRVLPRSDGDGGGRASRHTQVAIGGRRTIQPVISASRVRNKSRAAIASGVARNAATQSRSLTMRLTRASVRRYSWSLVAAIRIKMSVN